MRYLEQIEQNDLHEFELMTVVNEYDDELDSEEGFDDLEEEEFGLDEDFEADEDGFGLGEDDMDDDFDLEEEGDADVDDDDEDADEDDFGGVVNVVLWLVLR